MASSAAKILEFLHICGTLKRTLRTGWVNHKVADPENVASHMYRMSLISMLVPDNTIDKTRCIKMAIVHDLAESIVGDITPYEGVTKEDKFQREKNAIQHMTRLLSPSSSVEATTSTRPGAGDLLNETAKEIYDLWMEYEQCETPEAKLVKDIDKFEMILQAYEYEKEQGKNLQDFFNSTRGKFQHPWILDLVGQLEQNRAALSLPKDNNNNSGSSSSNNNNNNNQK